MKNEHINYLLNHCERLLDIAYSTNNNELEAIAHEIKATFNLCINDPPEAPQPLRVCSRCLMAIESHEGQQTTRKIYLDTDDEAPCDWCGEFSDGGLYEIL